jgi:hypothetical protein
MSEVNENLEIPVSLETPLSTSGEITPSTEIAATELPPIAEPVVVIPELTYSYQPTDEQGRAIGGKQVIKYTTPDELTAKLTEQTTLLIRKLRSETKKNRLGIQDDTTVEGQLYTAPVEFKPKTLTPDERYKLSRNLQDPEKFEEARDTLFESAFGAKPSDITSEISSLRADNIQMKAKMEADAFVSKNPDYVICTENFESVTNWMLRHNLAPVRDNFQKAFDALKEAGVLVTSTDVYSTPPPENPLTLPVEAIPATASEPTTTLPAETPVQFKPANIPTGLNRSNSTDAAVTRPATVDIVYERVGRDGKKEILTGLKAVEAMPSDELRRRTAHEPGFNKKLEKLEAEAQARRAAKNRQE